MEGTHILYHPDYSPEDDDPLQGIRFVIASPLGKSVHSQSYHKDTGDSYYLVLRAGGEVNCNVW